MVTITTYTDFSLLSPIAAKCGPHLVSAYHRTNMCLELELVEAKPNQLWRPIGEICPLLSKCPPPSLPKFFAYVFFPHVNTP